MQMKYDPSIDIRQIVVSRHISCYVKHHFLDLIQELLSAVEGCILQTISVVFASKIFANGDFISPHIINEISVIVCVGQMKLYTAGNMYSEWHKMLYDLQSENYYLAYMKPTAWAIGSLCIQRHYLKTNKHVTKYISDFNTYFSPSLKRHNRPLFLCCHSSEGNKNHIFPIPQSTWDTYNANVLHMTNMKT